MTGSGASLKILNISGLWLGGLKENGVDLQERVLIKVGNSIRFRETLSRTDIGG